VSATTRPPRDGERDGAAYHFLDRAEFERRVAADRFLEWAEYGGNLYGTLRSEVEKGLSGGRHVVLDIEVAGAEQLRATFPSAVRVFVLPPTGAALGERLRRRGTESEAVLARRMAIAARELELAPQYDYVVVNDDLVDAVGQVAAILDVEARRTARMANLVAVVKGLRDELEAGAKPGVR
jgi:guanylate kinase